MPVNPEEFNLNVGQRIYNARKLRGLTRAQLGAIVNLHESTVKRYEDGMIQSLGIDKLATFADALGTTTAYLLGSVDKPDDFGFNAIAFEYALIDHLKDKIEFERRLLEIEQAEADLLIAAREICGIVKGMPIEKLISTWRPERINIVTDFIRRNADLLRAQIDALDKQ